ncbi:phosphoribosylformylglycinamidine synthase [Clostridiaceae bacterium 14S0207]|nr:phosphoribosylformylglycinamidine synthase [Clostridiaceae bacterium 14S0207]
MNLQNYRVFVEKKPNFNVEAQKLLRDFKDNLGIEKITNVRLLNRYDVFEVNEEEFNKIKKYVLSEPNVDMIFEKDIEYVNKNIFAVEFLKGQYYQRADSAEQCIKLILQGKECTVKNARVILIEGDITSDELDKIKNYYINKVDSKETSLDKIKDDDKEIELKNSVEVLESFNTLNDEELKSFLQDKNLAMSFEDLKLCQQYFRKENKFPTITEIKVIDTYWSDHCRHTTFNTILEEINIEEGKYTDVIQEEYKNYLKIREKLYIGKDKKQTLMDLAVIGMKQLRADGKLEDLDKSDEINACSIVIDVKVDEKNEKWLLMFKNETHNHPTEIEPFGGASTCLGGAIRDPLSGRSYVYQAMRVTGAADPRKAIDKTLKGKLPQSKITKEAARGYSSYGNQIGLATGQVTEIYDEGFLAKRMEVGAVIGATSIENVRREEPKCGDLIILLGGRTGRDGCGGASGSSKEHTEKSILTCGSEVQKGNAPTERKIQRLFRNPKVTTMIKRCNDFGAGGVSVAVGELAEGLFIDLDKVPKKYEGLDGTELAISESQERMAVVVKNEDANKFIRYAHDENLEAVVVAEVTEEKRVKIQWNNKIILDLSREFLDTNGARQFMNVVVKAPKDSSYFEERNERYKNLNLKEAFINNLKDLNVCSQKGLCEMFDSTVGASTVFMPFGGKNQLTPIDAMCAKIPVLHGETSTVSLMSYGYNPKIGKWSPFHGALYAVIESLSKIVASGGDYSKVRLSFQEYFEKLSSNEEKWGKPFSALLGALLAQTSFEIAAIGGKDSMSGTFKDINVPPTLISFAVTTVELDEVCTPEFKEYNNKVIMFNVKRNKEEIPDFNILKNNFRAIHELIKSKNIISASAIKFGGVAESISKMCFGNKIGFKFEEEYSEEELFSSDYGNIVVEFKGDVNILDKFHGISYKVIGKTIKSQEIHIANEVIKLNNAIEKWEETLEPIFPTKYKEHKSEEAIGIEVDKTVLKNQHEKCNILINTPKPKVLIPVFPGSNCEYDSKLAFEKAGAETKLFVFNNLTSKDINESIENMEKLIRKSQIIMIPGGFSAGDEPDGSGKFIAAIFRNERIKQAVREHLNVKDGLMLGICNGFQALIKLGLVPYGDIVDIKEDSPTLTFNSIGRHISCVVNTKVVSTKSPWFNRARQGDIYTVPVSHGEGRFYATDEVVKELFKNGQVATQYVDSNGNHTNDIKYNPNGSVMAIEGITSPDGRVLGKMGHTERISNGTFRNVEGNYNQSIFTSGVEYFK